MGRAGPPGVPRCSLQALACCEALVESTEGAIGAPAGTQHKQRGALLALHCAARVEHAMLLAQHAPSQAGSLVAPALALARERPGDYHAVHAAAVMLEQAQRAGQEPLPTQQLQASERAGVRGIHGLCQSHGYRATRGAWSGCVGRPQVYCSVLPSCCSRRRLHCFSVRQAPIVPFPASNLSPHPSSFIEGDIAVGTLQYEQ